MSGDKALFYYGEGHLTSGIALQIADGQVRGVISENCKNKIRQCRASVDRLASGQNAVYGINTGFGPLCSTRISSEEIDLLQYNILKSHSVGVGPNIPLRIAKLMLILKMHALCKGYSGIALSTLDRINWHIVNDAIPLVPSQGSVGASGDLAPLSHLFLPLIGFGEVNYKGKEIEGSELLKTENLEPIMLHAKEGLALINGTQFITAYSVSIVDLFHSCLFQADLIAAMMLEGLLGSPSPFKKELHELRPFPGNQHVAERITLLLKDSEIVDSHEDCDRVQDPYSLRCIPQVHGASRTAWLHLKNLVEIELNSVTDNPVILENDEAISGGNFHGQPLALALDYVCFAASEIGNVSDRRTYLSLLGVAEGVPKLLMENTGTNSAFMILQYTTAALVSENKTLCYPASADSIPTSLGQEDHVSMGSISARKAISVIENLEKILAIELLCAAQSFDFHLPLKSSPILNEIHAHVRSKVSHAEIDRVFKKDIDHVINMIHNRTILKIANESSQSLETAFESIFEKF